MSELRQDRTTGAWVVISPERRLRPAPRAAAAWDRRQVTGFDPACPFCPGNEAMLPSVIEEIPADRPPGWQVRVVPNKYPIVRPETAAPQPARCDRPAVPGHGFHEVVVESPRHDADLAGMSDDEIGAVLAAYHGRFVALAGRPGVESVILFRNHGTASGASLAHPHAQLVALAMTPPGLRSRIAWARTWHEAHGRCVLCDELALQRSDGRLVVEETRRFVALVPFAAACPFETWLIPKRHQASFAEIDPDERREIGPLLRDVLHRLKCVLGDPPYNFVVDSAGKPDVGRPDLHWRIRIAPGVARPGGFELAAGMPVNPSSPERDAEALRQARPAGSRA